MSDLIRSLRLFVRLTEEGSFSALGRSQNLSHTTIARAISDLELHFGVRLFQRTTRRQVLTTDGERLLEHAVAILDQVGLAESDLAGAVAARGLVRIGVTTALGLHYAERLGRLSEQHPELLVEWLMADWHDATDHGGLDLWLWVGKTAPKARFWGTCPGYWPPRRGTFAGTASPFPSATSRGTSAWPMATPPGQAHGSLREGIQRHGLPAGKQQ
ncbi:LysR family transcriptional regulator [Novosphingobium panipatense]